MKAVRDPVDEKFSGVGKYRKEKGVSSTVRQGSANRRSVDALKRERSEIFSEMLTPTWSEYWSSKQREEVESSKR